MAYDDAEVLYAEVRRDVTKEIEKAFDALFPKSSAMTLDSPFKASTEGIVAYNSTFIPRREVIQLPIGVDGSLVQKSKDGRARFALVDAKSAGQGSVVAHTDGNSASGRYLVGTNVADVQYTRMELTTLCCATLTYSLPLLVDVSPVCLISSSSRC